MLETKTDIEFESGDTLLSLAEAAYDALEEAANLEVNSNNVDECATIIQKAVLSSKTIAFTKGVLTFAQAVTGN